MSACELRATGVCECRAWGTCERGAAGVCARLSLCSRTERLPLLVLIPQAHLQPPSIVTDELSSPRLCPQTLACVISTRPQTGGHLHTGSGDTGRENGPVGSEEGPGTLLQVPLTLNLPDVTSKGGHSRHPRNTNFQIEWPGVLGGHREGQSLTKRRMGSTLPSP